MRYYIFILIAFAAVISCNKESSNDNCVDYETAYVTSVNGPSTGTVNQDLEFEVDFNIKNGCGKFFGFEESNNVNSKIIKVNTKYEGCVCTDIFVMQTEIYTFRATVAGDYELKFLSGEDEYIVVVISIT